MLQKLCPVALHISQLHVTLIYAKGMKSSYVKDHSMPFSFDTILYCIINYYFVCVCLSDAKKSLEKQ